MFFFGGGGWSRRELADTIVAAIIRLSGVVLSAERGIMRSDRTGPSFGQQYIYRVDLFCRRWGSVAVVFIYMLLSFISWVSSPMCLYSCLFPHLFFVPRSFHQRQDNIIIASLCSLSRFFLLSLLSLDKVLASNLVVFDSRIASLQYSSQSRRSKRKYIKWIVLFSPFFLLLLLPLLVPYVLSHPSLH